MDRINFHIDQLLEETTKLVSLGIITKQECKDIMKKREYHEIKIFNRNSHKSDYLTYIKYELELDRLFHKRGQDKQIDFDFRLRSALRHAINLFGTATKRFPRDEALWINALNIRMKRASKEGTGRLFSIALQNIPRSATLWKLAATFEFEVNKNIQNARNLIQAGIQFNKTDKSLWHYFFLMELTYISLLYNDVTFIDETNKKIEEEEIKLNIDGLRKTEKIEQDEFVTFGRDILSADKLKNSLLIRGQIAQIVYRNAMKSSIGQDFDFRKQFYKIASKFLGVGKDSENPMGAGELLQKEILESLITDFQNNEKTYIFLASIEQSKSSEPSLLKRLNNSTSILDQGLSVIKSESYLFNYIHFIRQIIVDIKLKEKNIVEKITEILLKAYKYSIENNILKESGYQYYIELLLELGKANDAIKVSEESVKLFKNSNHLWSQRINLLIKNEMVIKLFDNLSNNEYNNLDKCFEMAVKNCAPSSQTSTSNLFIEYFKYQVVFKFDKDFKKIVDLFEKLLKQLDGNAKVQNNLKNFLLDYTFLNLPKEKLKSIYQLCFNYLPIPKEFYQKCILYEEERIEKNVNDIRSLYEKCLSIKEISSKDVDVWLNYRNFELKSVGDIERANTIATRGKKALADPLPFLSQLQ
ncbi:hypothetical protein RB653_004144 [Dictyostelium firmibasis]|uniref:U3 small nucleolar RNA-associated protein 6 homolog n=1 Tax=Dictyostelium firmibasis TaxID=79012 RepID=A0AAN7YS48_9MYCE